MTGGKRAAGRIQSNIAGSELKSVNTHINWQRLSTNSSLAQCAQRGQVSILQYSLGRTVPRDPDHGAAQLLSGDDPQPACTL